MGWKSPIFSKERCDLSQEREYEQWKGRREQRVGLRQKWIHREEAVGNRKKKNKNSIFTESGRARNVRTSDMALLLSVTSFTSNFQKGACGGETARALSRRGFKHFVQSSAYVFLMVEIHLNSAPSRTDKGLRLPALPWCVCVLSDFLLKASKKGTCTKVQKKNLLKVSHCTHFHVPVFHPGLCCTCALFAWTKPTKKSILRELPV